MAKKWSWNYWLIGLASILITGILCFGAGYIVGRTADGNSLFGSFLENQAEEESYAVVGVYFNTDWNGRQATLELYADGTCKYPTGSPGNWKINDGKVEINLGVDEDDMHTATIVDNGVVLHSHFFEKIG